MKRIQETLAGLFDKRSISFRLYLIIIPTTLMAVSLISYVDSRVASILMEWQVEANTLEIATGLAADLARPATPLNREGMHPWLAQLVESNSNVSRIEVFQVVDGNLTRIDTTSSLTEQPISIDEITAVQTGQTALVPLFRDRGRAIKVIVPVKARNGPVTGCVSVTSSLHQADLVTGVQERVDLFLIPTSVILMFLMLHYLFTRGLTRRIARLGNAMTEARQALGRRAPVERNDELGVIAQRFNETMVEIDLASRERDRLLEEQKDFNTELRMKVQEATKELSTANQQLIQANQDLMDTQRRLTRYERMAVAGQMAATFAHEIGSPLSAISTHLELMAEEPHCNEEARRRVRLIQEQMSRITGFVEELLTETRLAVQTPTRVQLNELLQQLLAFVGQHLERHGIRAETSFLPGLPGIAANSQQLQQVFLNLFNNAVDALPQGGIIRVETRIEKDDQNREQVAAVISDNGVGIPKEEQQRIFEPFFSTKDLRRGTGLGLSIAARIVRQHQGSIQLSSESGKGTTFTIRFPVLPAAEEKIQPEEVNTK